MRRLAYFLYYLWALLEPQDDTNIWSISLAWRLATIADEDKQIDERREKRRRLRIKLLRLKWAVLWPILEFLGLVAWADRRHYRQFRGGGRQPGRGGEKGWLP